MVQPGISALLEGYGKISKKPRSFDYLVDEIVVYDKLAAAAGTPESTRVQVYSTAIVAAFGECAISDALVLSSKDPTDTLPAELVVDGSGALDALAAAKELLPQQAAMVYGPRGLNLKMAIAIKRHLGVGCPFIGGQFLTTGALAYIGPDKVLKTDVAIREAIEGTMLLADWQKLVGLLNHLVCMLLMPYHIMSDVYDIRM